MLKCKLLLSSVISLCTLWGHQAVSMDIPSVEEKDSLPYSSHVHQMNENFYVGRMRSPAGKALWLVMERIV